MEDQSLIVTILMMLAVGGVFYVFVYPYLSGQEAAEKRRAQFDTPHGATAYRLDTPTHRPVGLRHDLGTAALGAR